MARKRIHHQFIDAYVYVISVDGIERYIGKGRRTRAVDHFGIARCIIQGKKTKRTIIYADRKIAEAMLANAKIEYAVLFNGLSDEEAYAVEVLEIALRPPGQLWNEHKGGSGGDAEMMRKMWEDPAFRERCIAAQAEGRKNPEFIQGQRDKTNALWRDPEFVANWTASHRAVWDDPIAAAERKALLKKVWSNPALKAAKSALTKSQWTPERSEAQAAQRAAAWANPEFKMRVSKNISAAHRRAQRERMRANGQTEFDI